MMAEVSGHLSEHVNITNFFMIVKSTLYMVTKSHPKAETLLNIINVFCSENLTLFMITSIHSIRKTTKNRNSKTRREVGR